MKFIDIVVTVLLVIGAINLGLIGLFNTNLVEGIFGEFSAFTRVIYVAVGLCGLYEAFSFTVGYEKMKHRWCDMPKLVIH